MDFRYEQFDKNVSREINLKKLTQLFLELLNQSSQNVDEALRYMEKLWERHDLEQSTGMTFPEFRDFLEQQGLLERNEATGQFMPTARADREIQKAAFEEIFQDLKKDSAGNHAVHRAGIGGDRLPETRPYEFGDNLQDVDFTASIGNAVRRTGIEDFGMSEDDLETHQREHLTSVATVILIDISHSMILYGEDRITPAKKVAMALTEYIQQKYPKDVIDVVLFGDDAHQVDVDKIARVSVGPFHTNTKAGLQMGMKLLQKRKQANKQIFMITDGKPSAIWENGELYKNPFGLDPKIVAQTVNEAALLRRKNITITTFMITSDPYLQDFVDTLTRANKGRAYFASLDTLGKFIFADYARNKKKRV
ncbi:VWA domain-containing protein [soil metagenome]